MNNFALIKFSELMLLFVKHLDAGIMRAIEKPIKGINYSVFIAESEQEIVNKF